MGRHGCGLPIKCGRSSQHRRAPSMSCATAMGLARPITKAGTLRMGISPANSVTTPNARFHHVVNAYVAGPALLPSLGSPNPMLSGVALARRIAEHLVAPLPPPALEAGYQWLFDGTPASFANWQQAGPGNFDLDAAEQVLVARPGAEIGLLFYAAAAFSDFTLRLQFRVDSRATTRASLCGSVIRGSLLRRVSMILASLPTLPGSPWIRVSKFRSTMPLNPIRRTSIGQGRSTISI